MEMNNMTFGITMLICGMGGLFLTLWIMSLIVGVLGRSSLKKKKKKINIARRRSQNVRGDYQWLKRSHCGLSCLDWRNIVMLMVSAVLLYLGIKKDCEPLLLVPIGFGCLLVNIPLTDIMGKEGFLKVIYTLGVDTELYPLLIFVGIGAMTDFSPLLANPMTFLLGAAGHFGIFLTLLLALGLGFDKLEAVSIGIIGACDGPTAIYVTSKYAASSFRGSISCRVFIYVVSSGYPASDYATAYH